MAELITGLHPQAVGANLERLHEEIRAASERSEAAGVRPRGSEVEVLAATKYIPLQELPVLAEAGIRLLGENRAQDLQHKVAACGELFEWDFIGQLQSRRVRLIVPHVRLIHSVASESALRELARHQALAHPGLRILIEVNLAQEPGKAGEHPHRVAGEAAGPRVPWTEGDLNLGAQPFRWHSHGRDGAGVYLLGRS